MKRKNPFTDNSNSDEQPSQEPASQESPVDEPQAQPDAAEPTEAPAAEEPKTPEQERDELMGRLQRLAADYQNYQKRAAKDTAQAREFANESLIRALLPVLDDMERALEAAGQHHGQDDPFYTGMQMVHEKMLAALGQFGVTRIEAADQAFDPAKHSALMQQPTADVAPMMVLQVVQQGYELKGRTLRPAGVIVSREPDQPAESEESEK